MMTKRGHLYRVVRLNQQDGTTDSTNMFVLADRANLHNDQFQNDNPRSMGSNEWLEPMDENGEECIIWLDGGGDLCQV